MRAYDEAERYSGYAGSHAARCCALRSTLAKRIARRLARASEVPGV